MMTQYGSISLDIGKHSIVTSGRSFIHPLSDVIAIEFSRGVFCSLLMFHGLDRPYATLFNAGAAVSFAGVTLMLTKFSARNMITALTHLLLFSLLGFFLSFNNPVSLAIFSVLVGIGTGSLGIAVADAVLASMDDLLLCRLLALCVVQYGTFPITLITCSCMSYPCIFGLSTICTISFAHIKYASHKKTLILCSIRPVIELHKQRNAVDLLLFVAVIFAKYQRYFSSMQCDAWYLAGTISSFFVCSVYLYFCKIEFLKPCPDIFYCVGSVATAICLLLKIASHYRLTNSVIGAVSFFDSMVNSIANCCLSSLLLLSLAARCCDTGSTLKECNIEQSKKSLFILISFTCFLLCVIACGGIYLIN